MTTIDITARSDTKLTPADWQREDLARLAEQATNGIGTANWSDMGCYKTSTSLWLMDYLVKHDEVENPAILVVTNRSGKGAFFRDIPQTVDGYTILNVGTQKVSLVMDGREFKLTKELPEAFAFPAIVVTHYHVFAKCNLGKTDICTDCDGMGTVEEATPIRQPDGTIKLVKLACDTCSGRGSVPLPDTQGDRLLRHKWFMAIVDEGHRIKNRDTKWTENIKRIKADYNHIMTGTGFINRPDEIWSLLNFLDKRRFSSYWAFREHFCEVDIVSGWEVVKGCLPERKDEFRQLVREVGPRREKVEVFKDLPHPIYEDITVELSATQRRMYTELVSQLQALDQKGVPLTSPNVLSLLNRLRQVCVATPQVVDEYYDPIKERRITKIELVEPSSKLDALMDVIEGLRWDDDDRQQIVVFSNFVDPLKLLSARLLEQRDKRGRLVRGEIPHIWLKSEDNDQTRYMKWFEAWPKKEHQVFLSTMQLGGESIDLTSAEYVAFLDQSWSPKDNNQARDRVWRPGQTKTAVVIKLFAENSVDSYVFSKLETKQRWFDEIFGKDAKATT